MRHGSAAPRRPYAKRFEEALDGGEGWAKDNARYWERDYRGFLEFFFSQVFTEPYSTRPAEDGVSWGVGATVVSAVLDLAARGVKSVGTLPQGVPVPALPWTKRSDVGPLLVGAVGIMLVYAAEDSPMPPMKGCRLREHRP